MKKVISPYIKVETKQGISYGENQAWLPYKFLEKTGCGVIGATDVALPGRERADDRAGLCRVCKNNVETISSGNPWIWNEWSDADVWT